MRIIKYFWLFLTLLDVAVLPFSCSKRQNGPKRPQILNVQFYLVDDELNETQIYCYPGGTFSCFVNDTITEDILNSFINNALKIKYDIQEFEILDVCILNKENNLKEEISYPFIVSSDNVMLSPMDDSAMKPLVCYFKLINNIEE